MITCVPRQFDTYRVTESIATNQGHTWIARDGRCHGSFDSYCCWKCARIKHTWIESGWGSARSYFTARGDSISTRYGNEPACVEHTTPCAVLSGCER
jgi:hypothetical protein